MKRLMIGLLVGAVSLPSWAFVKITDIQVSPAGQDARQPVVTVTARNTGRTATQVDNLQLQVWQRGGDPPHAPPLSRGPTQVRLGGRWQTVQFWRDPVTLAPGKECKLEVRPAADSVLGQALLQESYRLNAVVTSRPQTVDVEAAGR